MDGHCSLIWIHSPNPTAMLVRSIDPTSRGSGRRCRQRATQQKPLTEGYAQPAQRRALSLGLDALADEVAAHLGGEMHEPCDVGLAGGIGFAVTDQAQVELHVGGAQGKDMP